MTTVLRARVGVQLGRLDLDVELTADDGEVVALLGPNGAGKTTVLRALAGLQPLDHGRIEVDGQILDAPEGTDASAPVFVPPDRRPIGLVFQDYLLFPRMSALDNVAFGLRARGRSRADARTAAAAWLQRLDLADHAGARPAALSGGQAQRVALARALATEPRLLLLDEPLAALDARARIQVRAELRRHLAMFPGARLLVTHDLLDAVVLADRLVVVENGRVTQTGSPAEVAAHPRSPYVADLVGVNLLHGHGTAADSADRVVTIAGTGARLTVADPVPAGEVAVVVRPQAVALHLEQPAGSPRNTWATTVAEVVPNGDRVRVHLAGELPLVAEVTPAALAELALVPGTPVWASLKAVDVAVHAR